MATVTELTEITLREDRRKWSLSAFGSLFLGSGMDRPARITAGKLMWTGIKEPIFGTGWGPWDETLNDGDGGWADGEVTVTPGADGSGVMKGKIRIRVVYHRELTGEDSLASEWDQEFDLGTTGKSITVKSNSQARGEDLYISHRKYYINYVDKLGVYYLAAKVPYTDALDGDEAVINVAATTIINNEPLPDMRQTALFPAVRTAAFWKSRIWGAVLEPRELLEGTAITLINGSEFARINEEATVGGELWIESDYMRGIVDRDTNRIVAFIDRVIDGRYVRIRLPGDLRPKSTWDEPTVTFDNVALSGDEAMIFASPIWAGGPGGGIRYGMLSFNAIDVLRDEGFYSSGAKVARLMRAGEDLAVIYDRGIAIMSGDTSVGTPRVRQWIGAENVGTFNPDAIWNTPNGQLWFQGGGRIYTWSGGQVVDASQRMGLAGFWRKWVEANLYTQNLFQTAYNPDTNMALMVNIPKKGEGTGELGTYAIAICHDTQTVHPLRFPVKIKSVACIRHDDGRWQFYGGSAGSPTEGSGKSGVVYKLLVDGKKTDDSLSGDAVSIDQPIPWFYETGTRWANGTVQPQGQRLHIETEAEDGIDITVSVDLKRGNLNSPTFEADHTQIIPHEHLNMLEQFKLVRDSGRAVQYRYSGMSTQEMLLVQAHVVEEFQEPRVE